MIFDLVAGQGDGLSCWLSPLF